MPKTSEDDELERVQSDIRQLEARASLPAHRKAVAKAENKLREAKAELEQALKAAKPKEK